VASSLIYETIEWAVAVIIGPDAAMAFLGTRGDATRPVISPRRSICDCAPDQPSSESG